MQETNDWYLIDTIDQIDSPALVVYPERIKENIRLLKSRIDDPARLRPHVKTHKTKEIIHLLMDAGIQKFKCATIAEAELLGLCKAKDVLLAYQPIGPKRDRFLAVIQQYPTTKYACLIDNEASAAQLSAAALKDQLQIPVYIDLNVGMNRTGIKPDIHAIELYEKASKLKGIEVKGFHIYDGHIRTIDLKERTRITNESFAPVEEIRHILSTKGYENLQLIAGGTPTFPIYSKKKDVECGPGTFVFWDKGYQDTLPEQEYLIAALLVTRVISKPDETKICLDLGYKSIASENELKNRVYFINAPEVEIIGHSEEHLVVEAPKGHSWEVGDVFYGIPIHICPTCALYERVLTIENGKVSGAWEIIARKRSITL